MPLRLRRLLIFCVLVFCQGISAGASTPPRGVDACGHALEHDVWRLWSGSAKPLIVSQLVGDRLVRQGDTYALYDMQTYMHNLVAMAGRCGRTDQLLDMARVLGPVFAQLTPAPRGRGDAWVCRGGKICNERNRSLGGEVQLASVQFLGLANAVAARLADAPGAEAAEFRRMVAKVALAHLARWSTDDALDSIRKKALARSDGASPDPGLAFEDKQLWMIAIYADLAHLADVDPTVAEMVRRGAPEPGRFGRHLSSLLQLFAARVAIDSAGTGGPPTADIDRGFWRANQDNRYAGYDDPRKPVECVRGNGGRPEAVLKVPADRAVPATGSGWDLSHARRLVHALDALDLGATAMPAVFHISASTLPRADLRELLASQLVRKVWNQDVDHPLFRNFWGGANGWYRVAYDNGAGRCNEGTPPFGLSMAFVTGGYAAWGESAPEVGRLGRRLYELSQADDPEAKRFMSEYYADLSEPDGSLKGITTRLMFWPSLVYGNDGRVPRKR